jgi:hypothetical protein
MYLKYGKLCTSKIVAQVVSYDRLSMSQVTTLVSPRSTLIQAVTDFAIQWRL